MMSISEDVRIVREALSEHSPISDMDGPRCGMCGMKLEGHKEGCSYAAAEAALARLEARIAELADEVAGWLEIARSEGARCEALTTALRDLHAEVEMGESIGICLPDRVPSLRARTLLS